MTAVESCEIIVSFEKIKKDELCDPMILVIGSIILCLVMIFIILRWWI